MIRAWLWTTLVAVMAMSAVAGADGGESAIAEALVRAGDNRPQLESALERAPLEQRAGLRFLIENMPQHDLKSLSAEYLLENADYAYRAWQAAKWREQISEEIFLNDVLPYASINERRDSWRKTFFEQFRPLVADCESPGKAAAVLNQKVFGLLNVRYSTARPKADQSPLESIEAGLASCSGLSVLLVDACRATGVPARFAGTALWSDKSGNHSWVEVWDDGWHFTGAAEPAGDKLDQAWFIGRASTAQREHPLHAIFATSYKRTPQRFPLVWDRDIDYVFAVNVTDRYANRAAPLAEGQAHVLFCVRTSKEGDRCEAAATLRDPNGDVVAEGKTNDERFDANDHWTAVLKIGVEYEVVAEYAGRRAVKKFTVERKSQLVELEFTDGEKPSSE